MNWYERANIVQILDSKKAVEKYEELFMSGDYNCKHCDKTNPGRVNVLFGNVECPCRGTHLNHVGRHELEKLHPDALEYIVERVQTLKKRMYSAINTPIN